MPCYLPEDLLLEIFVRLPFKSICKFRCVSTSCFNLFTNPSFINCVFNNHVMTSCGGNTPWTLITRHEFKDNTYIFCGAIHKLSHFSTSSTKLHLKFASSQLHHELISSKDGFSFEFDLGSTVRKHDIFPLASSNGLVLCSTKKNNPKDYFISNPFTRQCVSLPLPRPNTGRKGLNGFVFEPSTGTYKVIYITNYFTSRNFSIQIFSSDRGEWSTHSVPCSQHVNMTSNVSHIVNHSRIWYWIDGEGDRMVAYNDNNGDGGGECRLINLPNRRSWYLPKHQQCLGESKGLLCYGRIEKQRRARIISVWVFDDGCYNNGITWRLKCKATLEEDNMCASPWPIYHVQAFSPVDPDVVIIKCHLDASFHYEAAYNVKTGKSEVLCSSRSVSNFYGECHPRIVVTLQPTIIPTTVN